MYMTGSALMKPELYWDQEHPMIVRIRFGRGRLVTNRKGKNSRAARLLASLLPLVAISFAIFGFWRLGHDLDILGDFVFPTGLFLTGRSGLRPLPQPSTPSGG